MEITLTWHLLLMIVVSTLFIYAMIKEFEDFTFAIYGIILLVVWLIYGGVVCW